MIIQNQTSIYMYIILMYIFEHYIAISAQSINKIG